MEIIAHRINTIKQLKNLRTNFGVEVDIRTYNNELVIGHDPFSNYINFNDWISEYKHRTLILNVKEDGLEDILLLKMKLHNIKKFFLLDQGFPYLVKTINNGEKRCSIRFSEYESINTALSLKGKVEWVWVDFFTKFPLNLQTYNILKNSNFKLCIVSPELQGHDDLTCVKLKNYLIKNKISLDAVCTKKMGFWEECQ